MREAVALPGAAARFTGASGAVFTFRELDVAECRPVPNALMAATRNEYVVPTVRPETAAEVADEIGRETAVQVVPESEEYEIE